MRDKKIVVFSTADWYAKYLTNKQHTAKEFSRLGYEVIYVETIGIRPPTAKSVIDWIRLFKRCYTGLKSLLIKPSYIEKNIKVISPLVFPICKDHKIIKKINGFLLNRLVSKYTFGQEYIFWSYHPYIIDLLQFKKYSSLIYHCVDDLSSIPGVDTKKFNEKEQTFLSYCDYVFVTAPKLKERCTPYNSHVTYLPNVVDYEHFSCLFECHNKIQTSKKKIIYHGVLSDFKVNFELLYEVIKLHPEYDFILAGEEREGQSSIILENISALDNVKRVGYVPYNKLPNLLSQCDLGILPSHINDYTDSMFPMKFYEFIAAGLPVVSTKLHALNNIENNYLGKFTKAEQFELVAKKLLANGKIPKALREELIGPNTWRKRTAIMLDIIGESGFRTLNGEVSDY